MSSDALQDGGCHQRCVRDLPGAARARYTSFRRTYLSPPCNRHTGCSQQSLPTDKAVGPRQGSTPRHRAPAPTRPSRPPAHTPCPPCIHTPHPRPACRGTKPTPHLQGHHGQRHAALKHHLCRLWVGLDVELHHGACAAGQQCGGAGHCWCGAGAGEADGNTCGLPWAQQIWAQQERRQQADPSRLASRPSGVAAPPADRKKGDGAEAAGQLHMQAGSGVGQVCAGQVPPTRVSHAQAAAHEHNLNHGQHLRVQRQQQRHVGERRRGHQPHAAPAAAGSRGGEQGGPAGPGSDQRPAQLWALTQPG